MAQRKTNEDGKTQRQKFVDAARELGADSDRDAFRGIVRKVATAKTEAPKKGARKPKS